MSRREGWLRYKKAPILEAVLEFRWSSLKAISELEEVLRLPAFGDFEEPKPRFRINAKLDAEAGTVMQDREQLGFEVSLRDGSERVFLEKGMFVFIQSAPYDRWDTFCSRALALLGPTVEALDVAEFSRVGLRFVNRIDAPHASDQGVDTDDYICIQFNGPRKDKNVIKEFQMRVVKPTDKEGISYALMAATTASPLPKHSGIILDIDVFAENAVPSSGEKLIQTLGEMRVEKNDIFEECLTDKARTLFGGVEE